MDEAIDEISESVRANMHILADRIRILRNEKGISAREMSLALGQNVNYINLIENGKRSPSFELFFDICDFFDITPEDFFKYDNYTLDNSNTGLENDNQNMFFSLTSEQKLRLSDFIKSLKS